MPCRERKPPHKVPSCSPRRDLRNFLFGLVLYSRRGSSAPVEPRRGMVPGFAPTKPGTSHARHRDRTLLKRTAGAATRTDTRRFCIQSVRAELERSREVAPSPLGIIANGQPDQARALGDRSRWSGPRSAVHRHRSDRNHAMSSARRMHFSGEQLRGFVIMNSRARFAPGVGEGEVPGCQAARRCDHSCGPWSKSGAGPSAGRVRFSRRRLGAGLDASRRVQRVSLKNKSHEAGNQQQSTGRDQAMREGHSGNPIGELEHRAKCAGVTPTIKQAVQKVDVPSDRRRTARLTWVSGSEPVQSLVSEALKVRAVLYCLSSSGSSRHSTVIRIIDKILAAIERKN
jgi:hypothetical protein